MSVTLEMKDGVAGIVMDDGKVNAVSHDLLEGLEGALDKAEREAKAVLLSGRPGVFSGGFDLAVIKSGDREKIRDLATRGGMMVHRLFGFPKPVVAAATGHGVALGALWLLAADVRIGADGAYKIGLNETAIGEDLPIFGTEIAKARLNPAHLTTSILHSRIHNPKAAVDVGFLDHVVAEGQVIGEAFNRARALSELPGRAYARNKLRLRKTTLEEMFASLTNGPFV